MRELVTLTAVLICAAGVSGQGADSGTVEAKKAAGCRSALDLIASQNPQLPMHPVFQEILNSPSLKGTLFVPTAKAWADFFATIRQRQGNPEAPAMVARYGQIMLYHLAQDVAVPIAVPTPGANRFAFDTASTLQCSVGPSLPNNRIIARKTPQAIFLQHGTGNATIVSQPIPYCGGEAYLVDQVLIPCSDIAAIMGEIANTMAPCKNNVEGVLHRNSLTYYNALLLATGANRPIFSAVRNFTLFVPTDAAIQAAYDSGTFDYPEMFARKKGQLTGMVAYHAVPQYAHTAPGPQTARMETLLSQGQGNVTCVPAPLSWRSDGFVYGGSGAGKVSGTYDRGCAAVIFQVDSILSPCCKPMTDILGGMKAPKDSFSAKAIAAMKERLKAMDSARSTFILPTEAAWQALGDEAAAAGVNLTSVQVSLILDYLYTGADVASVVESATPVKTALSLKTPKERASLCPRATNATLVFAYDDAPAAAAAANGATDAVAAAAGGTDAAALPAVAAAAPATAAGASAGAATLPGAAEPVPDLATFGATAGPAAPAVMPAAAAAAPLPDAPAAGPATAAPMAATTAPGVAAPTANLLTGRRLRAKLPTTAGDSLLLPTTFSAGPATAKTGPAVLTGPVMVLDGAALELQSRTGIPVASITYACDGTIYSVNAVPLPCNFLGRRAVVKPVAASPKALPLTYAISADLVNTSSIPGAVANVTSAAGAPRAGGGAVARAVASAAAAVLLGALLL